MLHFLRIAFLILMNISKRQAGRWFLRAGICMRQPAFAASNFNYQRHSEGDEETAMEINKTNAGTKGRGYSVK